MADLGDGWNPTYAIADAISRESLLDTRAGRVLVMGGDQVYPYPSRDAYARRTESPYTAAFSDRKAKPDVFAIPGNHDWFDSLIAFSRLFCHPDRGFAGCRTRQMRSYFALKLPHDWWLAGIDLQLGADFDEPQVQYFRRMSQQMSPHANVILCVPEPQWIYELAYPNYEAYAARTLEYFERDVLQRPVRVKLTGDLHFYKRHADSSGAQQIISGGGGAFLHPSHRPDVPELRNGFTEQAVYPSTADFQGTGMGQPAVPLAQPQGRLVVRHRLWLVRLVRLLAAGLPRHRDFPAGPAQRAGGRRARSVPRPVADVRGGGDDVLHRHAFARVSRARRRPACHRAPAGGADTGVAVNAPHRERAGHDLRTIRRSCWPPASLTFVSGGVVGGFVLGLYLLISMSVFGRHANEAYSSLRIQDFKQWLRLRIDRDGVLTGWCFAIDRVPRRWRDDASGRPQADDARATQPRVVDQFSVRPRS